MSYRIQKVYQPTQLITLQSNLINPELVYLDIHYPGEKPKEHTVIPVLDKKKMYTQFNEAIK